MEDRGPTMSSALQAIDDQPLDEVKSSDVQNESTTNILGAVAAGVLILIVVYVWFVR